MSEISVELTPGAAAPAKGAVTVGHFKLANGLEVVVIPDNRTPVVTHMIWYKNGAADDPLGKSGIAHFLEHLMFKGTKAHPQGAFSDLVAELGGQENAFTGYDYTAYFQRIGKEHLATMMRFEADRMRNLVLTDEVVNPEREVVLEERRMRVDNDPSALLGETVQATLFARHPYGAPVIGWKHEIEGLSRDDALDYYTRFYTPENAVLIVAGDVEPQETLRLAQETYGGIAARAEPPARRRPQEPPQRASRLVTLTDEKVEQPGHERVLQVPSYATATPGEAEALEVLTHILGGGPTSVLYETLVEEEKLAVGAGAYYLGSAVDDTRLYFFLTPAEGVTLEDLDAALDRVLERFLAQPIDEAALRRAKTRLVADAVYARDSQVALARWYGEALTTGSSVADVAAWTDRIDAVTATAIQDAARKWLDKQRSVTGFLLPETEAAA
ncbi:MAG TPA: pitrilysin family protein [Methylocystis sp.]|nr:pitrilysin family protein [Methylocystis sp.]